MLERIKFSKRVCIKAGTSMLTDKAGFFCSNLLDGLGQQILSLIQSGREVVLVSSGAIGLGMEIAGYKKRPREMAKLQACAAIGQGKLMHAYERFFSKKDVHTAQILLTRDGLEQRERFLRARCTMEALLRMKVIPIVNENDTVSTEEIGFGDNDNLSVHVAHLMRADLLILLSDVDGFYLRDGSRIRLVESKDEIDNELVKHIVDRKKEKNVGGMQAKLRAAGTAMKLGIPLLIVNGHDENVVQRALQGDDVGTLFLPGKGRKNSRRSWLAFSAPRQGTLIVDDGAHAALCQKKVSLLPRGLLKVRGTFDRGAVVELETRGARVFGRGVSKYSSEELQHMAGKKTNEIQIVLGYKHDDEVVHRNDMVLWD